MVNLNLIKIYLLCIILILGLTTLGFGAIVGLVPALCDSVAAISDTIVEVIQVTSTLLLGFIRFKKVSGGKSAPKSTIVLICAYIVLGVLQISGNLVAAIPVFGDVAGPLIKLIL